MRAIPVSELKPRSHTWLWPARLGLGKLALLDGDPGLGKSLLTLDLCARLSNGQPMPDGTPGPGVARCLFLNAEDGQQDTIRPRLEALGADLANVFVLEPDEALGVLPRLPGGLTDLDQVLADTQARLLVIDPIMSFLDASIVTGSDQSVRLALAPLAALAARHDCAVLLLRHLNKKAGQRALYRGGGSIALAAVCRSAWLLAADPQNKERRLLAQLKNNLAAAQPTLALTLSRHENRPPTLEWLGQSPLTADDLVGAAQVRQRISELDRAGDFLLDFLKAGPRTARQIWEAALPERLSKRTLQRAREELRIRIQWKREDGVTHTYWLLPGQELVDDSEYSLEEWLKPLREKHPPLTPLEEDEPR